MVSMMDKPQIPNGYMQTEVGVIPEDWNFLTIGEFCDVTSGGTPNRENKEYWDGDIPWITTALINGGEITHADQFITEKALVGSATKWIKKGALLIAMYGQGKTRGKISILGIDATINQACAAIAIKNSVSQKFLLHYLNSQYEEIRDLSNSGGQENLSGTIVKQIKIPVPKLQEQTAIANALSDVDALIAALEKLITKKTAIKTAAMQQLLTGKKRLPPFDQHHTGYKKTELGEIPEDWEVVELGNIGTTIIGLTYSPSDVKEFGTLVLRSSNVQSNKLAFENNVFVKMDLPDRVIVSEGDILICVRNGSRQLIGKCALIDAKTAGSAFGAFMSIYRSESSRFIFYQFQSNIIQNQINEVMGATINQITNRDMASFRILLPNNKEEQTAIANVLSDMDTELDALQQRLTKIQQLKQGMMQELLTGKTRLI